MGEITRIARCTQCGVEISDDQIGAVEPAPCPACGSIGRTISLLVSERLELHDSIQGKVRNAPGKKGVTKEFFAGDQMRNSKGDWIEKQRLIDKENDRYLETVRDKKTGEVIRHCEEPLSAHRGHGSAKFKKPDEPSS